LGAFTIVLAFIAAITAGILYITDQTFRKTLLIGQRAFGGENRLNGHPSGMVRSFFD
jgi:hypothetical protein